MIEAKSVLPPLTHDDIFQSQDTATPTEYGSKIQAIVLDYTYYIFSTEDRNGDAPSENKVKEVEATIADRCAELGLCLEDIPALVVQHSSLTTEKTVFLRQNLPLNIGLSSPKNK